MIAGRWRQWGPVGTCGINLLSKPTKQMIMHLWLLCIYFAHALAQAIDDVHIPVEVLAVSRVGSDLAELSPLVFNAPEASIGFDDVARRDNPLSGLLVRQSCPSGYGLCTNGRCCPLGGRCCGGGTSTSFYETSLFSRLSGTCCRSGSWCYGGGCCRNNERGCEGNSCCSGGSSCCSGRIASIGPIFPFYLLVLHRWGMLLNRVNNT